MLLELFKRFEAAVYEEVSDVVADLDLSATREDLLVLKDLGCDDMDMLVEGDDEDMADIIAAVEAAEEIKKLSVKKFKRELAKLRGKDETF